MGVVDVSNPLSGLLRAQMLRQAPQIPCHTFLAKDGGWEAPPNDWPPENRTLPPIVLHKLSTRFNAPSTSARPQLTTSSNARACLQSCNDGKAQVHTRTQEFQ